MTKSELFKIAKPILFNTEMVKAILAGRKTVARRTVKYKYSNTEMRMHTDKYGTRLIEIQKDVEGETHGKNPDGRTWQKLLPYIEPKPPFKKGEILYVRETWCDDRQFTHDDTAGQYFYKADFPIAGYSNEKEFKWKPSIHMPKDAARIFLKVKNVRVERLQNMTEDDVEREGIEPRFKVRDGFSGDIAKSRFMELWNSTIKKSDLPLYNWDANPWVWVIEFERIKTDSEV